MGFPNWTRADTARSTLTTMSNLESQYCPPDCEPSLTWTRNIVPAKGRILCGPLRNAPLTSPAAVHSKDVEQTSQEGSEGRERREGSPQEGHLT